MTCQSGSFQLNLVSYTGWEKGRGGEGLYQYPTRVLSGKGSGVYPYPTQVLSGKGRGIYPYPTRVLSGKGGRGALTVPYTGAVRKMGRGSTRILHPCCREKGGGEVYPYPTRVLSEKRMVGLYLCCRKKGG